MTRIQKRIDSFLYDTGGYSTQRIAVHGGEGLYRTEHTPDDKPIQGLSHCDKPSQPKVEPHNTRDEIAKDLNWSTGKVAQADKVFKSNDEETKRKVIQGVVSRFCQKLTNLGHVSDVSRVRGRRRRGVYHAYSASRSRADRVRELQQHTTATFGQ